MNSCCLKEPFSVGVSATSLFNKSLSKNYIVNINDLMNKAERKLNWNIAQKE